MIATGRGSRLDEARGPRAAIPFPDVPVSAAIDQDLAAEEDGDAARAVVDHGVTLARRQSHVRSERPCAAVPLPGLAIELVGIVIAAKEDGDTAGVVVGHRVAKTRRGSSGGSERPRAAIPLPCLSAPE